MALTKPWFSVRLRRFPISFRIDRRTPLMLVILVGIGLVALIINVSQGEYPVPPLEVLKTIVGLPANPEYAFVINTLRLPRALVALLVGLGLGAAGTLSQGLARNP
ncbi:MAG: iron chelate uptake ABC transporter family permease subunit, partial [Cyanobacteria bacterium P01_D01_bin.128]